MNLIKEKQTFKMRKQIVYTLPYVSGEDIRKASDLRDKLYEKYNNVNVYPNGLYEVRIIAE